MTMNIHANIRADIVMHRAAADAVARGRDRADSAGGSAAGGATSFAVADGHAVACDRGVAGIASGISA